MMPETDFTKNKVSKHLDDVRNAEHLRRQKEMLAREQEVNRRLKLQRNLMGGVDLMDDDDMDLGLNQIKYETFWGKLDKKMKKC